MLGSFNFLTSKELKHMPKIGCYTLDLYCDQEDLDFESCKNSEHEYGEFPHSFWGHTESECIKQAKRQGWRFHTNGLTSCPKCKNKSVPSKNKET
jgi:hypothetical protein